MRLKLYWFLGLIVSFINSARAGDLSQYAWEYRPVFVFASPSETDALNKQIDAFSDHRDAMQARDMALISVSDDTVSVRYGPKLDEPASDLRDHYDIPDTGFSLILVGKDTSVKLRRSAFTDPADIFDLIDSMPMRMQEMRRDNEGG